MREGVALRYVSFTFPGETAPALSSIDMEIRPGETVALVGENGAGKTTLTKILLGLYQPTGGAVTVDGTDLREIDFESWRDRVGAVFQDYMTYAFTARENIAMGRIGELANSGAIRNAAVRSGAHAVIEALPQGYETLLGREFEHGRDLSRGQWQSLAIACLHLRDCRAFGPRRADLRTRRLGRSGGIPPVPQALGRQVGSVDIPHAGLGAPGGQSPIPEERGDSRAGHA